MYPLYDHDLKVTSRPPYLAMTRPLYRTFLTHKSRTITMHGHKVHHNNATLQPPHHCALAILSAPPVHHAVYSSLLQRHWRGSTASGTGTLQLSLWSWHWQEAASCHVRTHIDTRTYVLTRYTQHISFMLFIKIAVALGAAFSPGDRYIYAVQPRGIDTCQYAFARPGKQNYRYMKKNQLCTCIAQTVLIQFT